MSGLRETTMTEPKRDWKADLKLFRERKGGMTAERKKQQKDQRVTEKAIHAALEDGPHTIPEIAKRAKLPSERAVWYVMALKRYGRIVEVDRKGDYYRYQWKEET
jgi:predicted Rossmann fold nucleotide-binding protein DprA/Smf involved in DNA uptake